jgi:hypothetical protein
MPCRQSCLGKLLGYAGFLYINNCTLLKKALFLLKI